MATSGPPHGTPNGQSIRVEPELTGWARLSDLIRNHDKERIEDVKEDVDTLLVFAGLFSAVITAFVLESYKNLQSQADDTTAQILQQITIQLSSLTISGGFLNSTLQPISPSVFSVRPPAILVNTLWSLSLVIALMTASLGILVKQWFHEFMARDTQDPRELVKTRFFRDIGMRNWHVFELASFLPFLLQLALLLFYVGLGFFLLGLNPIVGWITTGAMSVWLVVFIFTTISPIFSSQCPYKTPILKSLLQSIRTLIYSSILFLLPKCACRLSLPSSHRWWNHPSHTLYCWVEAWAVSCKANEEKNIRVAKGLDHQILACVAETLRGERLTETLSQCIQEFDGEDMIKCAQDLAEQDNEEMVPATISGATEKDVPDIILDMVVEDQHPVMQLDHGNHPFVFKHLYDGLMFALLRRYTPWVNYPIPLPLVPKFSDMIRGGSTKAVFAVLVMYSIRYQTIERYPDEWNHLFLCPNTVLYRIDEQYLLNFLSATRTIISSLWRRRHPDPSIEGVINCIDEIREDASGNDSSVPVDPLTLIHTFTALLSQPVSESIITKHQNHISAIMHDLAELVTEKDGSSWPYSRRRCVECACMDLRFSGAVDDKLMRTLNDLIRTWNPKWLQ